MSFSERYGYEPPKPLQVESMDDDLKMAIHNVIVEFEQSNGIYSYDPLYISIWRDFYIQDANDYYNGHYLKQNLKTMTGNLNQ